MKGMSLRVAIVCGLVVSWVVILSNTAQAQDNYEIQVYSYDTVEPHHTMVELHSNFTFEGSKTFQDGLLPTNHQLHETRSEEHTSELQSHSDLVCRLLLEKKKKKKKKYKNNNMIKS